jgi:cysteinyl-tRNA synthetase
MAAEQPTWVPPVNQAEQPTLKIYNSFTRSKTEFIPKNGRRVKWYNCGPTVYDASHMGHARNYVTQDVLRRIMTDYFGYDVHFVMNITDIDDKIILRARQQYLLNQFKDRTTSLTPQLLVTVREAWQTYVQSEVSKGFLESERLQPNAEEAQWPALLQRFIEDKAWRQECLQRSEKFEMHFGAARRAMEAIRQAESQLAENTNLEQASAHSLIDQSQDILSLSLDTQLKSSVTDPSVFRSLAAFWEDAFFKDMDRLKVLRPDILTRVTEYVPEIVQFVERIIANGYAYESEGSVYFDTHKFDDTDGHFYAKLEPWSKGNKKLVDEGEGALSNATGRHSKSDFALWKSSKPGEPSWPSPWGPGRPGWHIECSVMGSAIFGDSMDIHSGGIDLAFPHHDNEIAQSEAYHGCGAWVNYFIHTGHLHIEGLKMSKSLKNFITIEEILQRYTPRQLRLAFLTQLWNAKVDFSESLMTGEVRTIEQNLNNFFTTVKALVSQSVADGTKSDGYHHYEQPEADLTSSFYDSQQAFRAALCDSFNTPSALLVLRDLVSRTNTYIASRGKVANVSVIESIARWTGRMLRMFGLGEGHDTSMELGWGQEDEGGGVNREEVLMPYLRTLSTFRDSVRKLAIGKSETALKDILSLCDNLRDNELVPLGVALDDQEDGKALVKLVPPAELIRVRDEKRAQIEAKAAKKAAALEAERLKKLQKLEKGKVSPKDMFKPPYIPDGTYGSWDDQGLPLTDGESKELSKNQAKKVQKEHAAQKKLHEEYLAWIEQNPQP